MNYFTILKKPLKQKFNLNSYAWWKIIEIITFGLFCRYFNLHE